LQTQRRTVFPAQRADAIQSNATAHPGGGGGMAVGAPQRRGILCA
jgi:hypothetical protein